MKSRRNLTPPTGMLPGLPPTRRGGGGARHEVSKRVYFFEGDREITGWALNLSRGGLRAIIEDKVELGAEFKISIGDDGSRRSGRIVWIQDEPDGSIVGVSFLDDPPADGAEPRCEPHADGSSDGSLVAQKGGALGEPSPASAKEEDEPRRPPVRPEPPPEG